MIELFVNKEYVDLPDDGIGIRLNNKLNDPTKIAFTQAEYSFTFDLPCSKKNNVIFNHINVASVKNKFNRRYEASLYADSILLFEGSLKVTSIEDGFYHCNLYTPKVNTLESIFQDTKMNEFEWLVPFDGVNTINEVNANPNSKYFFPLVAYGLFQKQPEATDKSGYKYYTSKYTIDDTNKFYFNSFVPSLNMTELLKQLFKSKGYNLTGDITTDSVLSNIYLSNYIADGQDPDYNLGNPNIGSISFSADFKTYNTTNAKRANTSLVYQLNTALDDELSDELFVYNLLDTDNNTTDNLTLQFDNNSKMLIEDGIQIPADGWYEIIANYNMSVDAYHTNSSITIDTAPSGSTQTTIRYSLENMPMEWQLIRYSADDGDVSALSHEPILNGKYNEAENIAKDTEGGRNNATAVKYYTNIPRASENTGYRCITAVDNNHNPNLIVGAASSNYANTIGYAKNGKSYDVTNTTNNRNLYNCNAYYLNSGSQTQTQTDNVNKNTLNNSTATQPNYNSSSRTASGTTHNIIYLNKNDVLIPFFQQKAYYYTNTASSRRATTKAQYRSNIQLQMSIRAVAKQNANTTQLKGLMNTQFNDNLNLANFCNKEQKVTDFINNVLKAFNLSVQQKNDNVIINKLTKNTNNTATVNLDDKTNTYNAIFNAIDFPKSVTVKFNNNMEEEGIYRSAERNSTDEQLQSNTWTQYADMGYDTIELSQNDDTEDVTQSIGFSYTWYEDFDLEGKMLSIPVIGLTEWFIEDYKYEEMQLKDGRGLNQRFWFRQMPIATELSVYNEDNYKITLPIGYKQIDNGIVYLNYKSGNNTLLNRFFNIAKYTNTNEVEVECYLTPSEYMMLSKGANVVFDDDIYRVNEIGGYDPENINTTKLTLQQIN